MADRRAYCTEEQKLRLSCFAEWLQEKYGLSDSAAQEKRELLERFHTLQKRYKEAIFLDIVDPNDPNLAKIPYAWKHVAVCKKTFGTSMDALFDTMIQYAAFLKDTPGRHISKQKYLALPSRAKATNRELHAVRKKINRYFDKKPYLGDIPITDEEYEALLTYTRNVIATVTGSQLSSFAGYGNAPLLVLTMVQIGVRTYDGGFWPNAEKELGVPIKAPLQGFLGRSVIHTLQMHHKREFGASQSVNTILFHGFVSDHYAPALFELLYQYFSKDLERDIHRNDTAQMKLLMETLHEKADSGTEDMKIGTRSYKLRKHTLDAIAADERHSSMRLRRLIRLIDKAFWNDRLPQNPVSRLTKLFLQWKDQSQDFQADLNKRKKYEIVNKKKKHFALPYLFADISHMRFEVVLPSRLIRPGEQLPFVEWQVTAGSRTFYGETAAYPAVTGYKTEESRVSLPEELLFEKISCCLLRDGETAFSSVLPASEYRMFDLEGDYAEHPYPVPMCIFAKPQITFHSPALSDQCNYGAIRRWDFEFENGDALICSDRRSWVVGNRYEDQLAPRGCVDIAAYEKDGETYPVYVRAPQIIFKCPPSKLAGTAAYINGTQLRLEQLEPLAMEGHDSHGDSAYFIDLSRTGFCREQAFNEVFLDIPGYTQKRTFSFALLPGFHPTFADAPYVFQSRGTVEFPEGCDVQCGEAEGVERQKQAFNFELEPLAGGIHFLVGPERLPIRLAVPCFSWSEDGENFRIGPMGDVWHTEFPAHIFIRAPGTKLELFMDEGDFNDDEEEEHCLRAEPSRNGQAVRMDLTRVPSWFREGLVRQTMYLRCGKITKTFANIYLRSYVCGVTLSGNFAANELTLNCNIIGMGKTSYFCDIYSQTQNKRIAEKLPYGDKPVTISCRSPEGSYSVTIYEAEEDEDEFGFSEPFYQTIYQENLSVIDPQNLTGKSIRLTGLAEQQRSIWAKSLADGMAVVDLHKVQGNVYRGGLVCKETSWRRTHPLSVMLTVLNPGQNNRFYLQFYDREYQEFEDFIYDEEKKILVKEEEPRLDRNYRYRRYHLLDRAKDLILGDIL